MRLQDLNELQANAWVYWQAVENGEKGNWWGLMQVSAHTTHASGIPMAYPVMQQALICLGSEAYTITYVLI